MRMDGEMDRRLSNWARWRHFREDGGRCGSPSTEDRVSGTGWDAPTVIPTSDAEAEETQAGVLTMPSVLRYATEVWYLSAGGVAKRCARAQCSETEMRRRVALGHRHLSQWLHDRRQAAERERDRVTALQRTAHRA